MGLFDKVKNILFEEEEVEEVEVPKKEEPIKVTPASVPEYKPLPEQNKEVKPKEPIFNKVKVEPKDFSERELFRSESTFKFPAFDEEEFDKSMPHRIITEEKPQINREAELEKRRKLEKKSEYSRFDSFKAKETPVKEEKKKFRPSPVISPVYGILDKDYKAEDIMEAPKNQDNNIITSKDLDVDSVRAKAFGKLRDRLKEEEPRNANIKNETYDITEKNSRVKKLEEIKKEEKPVVKEKIVDDVKIEDDLIITDEPIMDDSHNLIEERSKTIDELLKDASDGVIDPYNEDKNDLLDSYETIESEIENELDQIIDVTDDEDKKDDEKEETTALENDTLENDLYDLIDSMYDNTEEGE